MLFRRIVLTAALVGVTCGILLTLIQSLGVWPVINSAEQYEQSEGTEHSSLGNHQHDDLDDQHHHEAWAPEDGWQRITFTAISNTLAGIGFAAIVLALMSQLQLSGITRLNSGKGLLWGITGFIVFFVAPGIGLPPEIPGSEAAPLGLRQAWWLFTVIMMAVGIGLLVFAPLKVKVLGLVMVGLPYLVGAPQHNGATFTPSDHQILDILHQLEHRFILVTSLSNFVFWLVLGVFCAWSLNRWILTDADEHLAANA